MDGDELPTKQSDTLDLARAPERVHSEPVLMIVDSESDSSAPMLRNAQSARSTLFEAWDLLIRSPSNVNPNPLVRQQMRKIEAATFKKPEGQKSLQHLPAPQIYKKKRNKRQGYVAQMANLFSTPAAALISRTRQKICKKLRKAAPELKF